MKKYLIVLLLLPILSFSQKIVGIWIKNPESKTAIEFTADGKINIIDTKSQQTIYTNLKVTYKLESENGKEYYIETKYKNDVIISTKKIKYKLKKGKLHLPLESEKEGKTTVIDYKDEYTKLK